MKKYIFKLSMNRYNNEESFYEIIPLPSSSIHKAYIFAGKGDLGIDSSGLIYIYLELTEDLTERNHFDNLQRILNLIYMETGTSTRYFPVPATHFKDFSHVRSLLGAKKFFTPGTSYHGNAPTPGHIARVKQCVELIQQVDSKVFEKFDNALNTYVWAMEIMELLNPHLKYTLYMTLFISSVEQLTNPPEWCEEKPVCGVCGSIYMHHRKGHSRKMRIDTLVRSLLTGSNLDPAIDMVNRLYKNVRSSFLHTGNLSGGEKTGGFLSNRSSEKLVEDMMNVLVLNRQLLEQFLVKNSSQLRQS